MVAAITTAGQIKTLSAVRDTGEGLAEGLANLARKKAEKLLRGSIICRKCIRSDTFLLR